MAKKKKAEKNRAGPFLPGMPIDDSELKITPGPPAEPWPEFFARLTNEVNGKGPCPTTEDIRTAIHFWQFYPGFHSQILATQNADAMIRLDICRDAACRIVATEIKRRGVKVSAFVESGSLCREVLLFHPEIGDENPRWPDCLRYKTSLIDDEAWSVIKEADDTLTELIAVLGVEDSPASLSASDHQQDELDSNISTTCRVPSLMPEDLVVMSVAISKFHVSPATLKRAVKEEKIKSYRPPNAAKNATHRFSESELERYYPRR